MLLKRGLQNNRDPSVTYRTIEDVEKFFRDIETTPRGGSVLAGARLAAVAAAHRIYTNSLATLPWMARKKEGDERLAPPHYLNAILKTGQVQGHTPYLCRKIQLSQAFWHGTGYIWVGRGPDGRVNELFPLPTEGHERRKDPETGQVWHIFSLPAEYPGALPASFRCQESSLLVHHFETFCGYSGVGMLELAKDVIDTDVAAQKYGAKFYRNGARISGVLEVPTELSPGNRNKVREDFERMSAGLDNAFRTAVLDLGMKYTPLGINQRDAQFLENRAFTVEEVARITGIPGYMLQTGKQSYQSNEQQQLDFVINTLTPPVTQMEQEWMRKLLRREEIDAGWYLKLNLASRLRGDDKSRSDFYRNMVGISALNPDEVRAMEENGPLPGGLGKRFYFSKNYDVVENFGAGKGD